MKIIEFKFNHLSRILQNSTTHPTSSAISILSPTEPSRHPTVNKKRSFPAIFVKRKNLSEMGKLSRTLLNSLFLTSVAAQEAVSAEAAVTFAVTSCNDESSPVSSI